MAIWPSDELAPVASEIADRVVSLGDTLCKLGARVSDTARPDFDLKQSQVSYTRLLNSVMGAAVPRDTYAATQATVAAMDPADRSEEAEAARAVVLSHRAWMSANNRHESLRYAWRDFFDEWDILICPQSATTAFPHDHSPISRRRITLNGEDQSYFKQLFWAGFAITSYLPSTVFPTGPSQAGLPIGLQAVGAEYDDLITIDFSRLIAREIGGFQPPPRFA